MIAVPQCNFCTNEILNLIINFLLNFMWELLVQMNFNPKLELLVHKMFSGNPD